MTGNTERLGFEGQMKWAYILILGIADPVGIWISAKQLLSLFFLKNRIFSYLRDSSFVCISYDFLLVYIFSLFFRFSQCCLAFQGWITHWQHIILMCEPCWRQLFSVILWIKPHMHRVTQDPAATKGSENWRPYPFPNPHSTRLETATFTSEVFLSWD